MVEAEEEFEFKGKLSSNFDIAFKSEMKTVGKMFEEEYFTRLVPSKNGNLVVRQNSSLGKEAYNLTVTKDKILVEASTGTGCFYAFQTIRQLMKLNGTGAYRIPACIVQDSPAYSWRSFMLDEGRNFYGTKVVKSLLDQMALLKMNTFHWHLTDDQGWRIEIKKYPLLTEVGAWRDSTMLKGKEIGAIRDTLNQFKKQNIDPSAHGGFYTQKEVKEIIAYASKLHITIVPEIEMPGHAMAAIASYPWLGGLSKGIKVPYTFGIKNYAFNVGDERVYGFIEDVLTEVMNLFPGKIIHIGGDEVNYKVWENNPFIKALMIKENLSNLPEVQLYFTNKISNFIEKSGKQMMGWNEIMGKSTHDESVNEPESKSNLAKSTIIHFWVGKSSAINDAVNKGYAVVNSESSNTYLDYTYEKIPLKKAYYFSPVPKGIDIQKSHLILGIGCQMWCNYLPKLSKLHYQTFPRIAAYAEVGWTREQNKDFDRFRIALMKMKKYWDKKGIYYFEE